MKDVYFYSLFLYFIFYCWQFNKDISQPSITKINVQIIHIKDHSFSQPRPISLPSLHFILDSFQEKLILYNPSAVASAVGFSGSGYLASGWHCSSQIIKLPIIEATNGGYWKSIVGPSGTAWGYYIVFHGSDRIYATSQRLHKHFCAVE